MFIKDVYAPTFFSQTDMHTETLTCTNIDKQIHARACLRAHAQRLDIQLLRK